MEKIKARLKEIRRRQSEGFYDEETNEDIGWLVYHTNSYTNMTDKSINKWGSDIRSNRLLAAKYKSQVVKMQKREKLMLEALRLLSDTGVVGDVDVAELSRKTIEQLEAI